MGCVQSIRKYTKSPYEIIVVDNGSLDGTLEFCLQEKITFIAIASNLGFPAACNLGMKISSGDALMLLNNDIVVSHNWLANQLNCLNSSDDIGIVGPYTNYASGRQQQTSSYLGIEQFHRFTQKRNQRNSELWMSVERLIGFCFLIKRSVVQQIGYLDELYSPGHFEDDDYCYRTRLAGYRLMIAGDVFVHHYGSASFIKDPIRFEELISINYNKFITKWGIDPHQFI